MKQLDLLTPEPVVEVQSTAFTKLLAQRRQQGQQPIAVTVTGQAAYTVTFRDGQESPKSPTPRLGPKDSEAYLCEASFNSRYFT